MNDLIEDLWWYDADTGLLVFKEPIKGSESLYRVHSLSSPHSYIGDISTFPPTGSLNHTLKETILKMIGSL